MFTGLIQTVGTVASIARKGKGARLVVRGRFADGPVARGESISVDGACLTVVRSVAGGFEADLGGETLARTTAAAWRPGRRVNLERALTPLSRLGGHLVQGHVDGPGRVLAVRAEGDQTLMRIEPPAGIAPLIAEKGSIAVDGVSLTVAAAEAGWFEVALVPATIGWTTLGDRRRGDLVNLEADLIARHLARLLEGKAAAGPPPPPRVRGGRVSRHNVRRKRLP